MRGVLSPPCKESRGCFRGLSTTTGETPPTSNPSETEEAAPPSNPSPLEEPSAIEGNKQKLHCPIAVFPLELSFKRRQCWMHCYGHQDNPSSQNHCGLRAKKQRVRVNATSTVIKISTVSKNEKMTKNTSGIFHLRPPPGGRQFTSGTPETPPNS